MKLTKLFGIIAVLAPVVIATSLSPKALGQEAEIRTTNAPLDNSLEGAPNSGVLRRPVQNPFPTLVPFGDYYNIPDFSRTLAVVEDDEDQVVAPAPEVLQLQQTGTDDSELSDAELRAIALRIATGDIADSNEEDGVSNEDEDEIEDEVVADDEVEEVPSDDDLQPAEIPAIEVADIPEANQVIEDEAGEELTIQVSEDEEELVVQDETEEEEELVVQDETEQEEELVVQDETEDLEAKLEELEELASQLADSANEDGLTEDKITELKNAIQDAEERISELNELLESEEIYLEAIERIEVASTDLANAKLVLNRVMRDLDNKTKIDSLIAEKESLQDAYCEQKSTIDNLTLRVEEFESSTFGQLNQRFDMLAQLIMMNLMAQSGPGFQLSPAMTLPNQSQNQNQNNFGHENGIRLLTLNDFFQHKALGGNMNVYNIGGNYIGGSISNGPFQGIPGAQATQGATPALSYPQVNPVPFNYNLSAGVFDSGRIVPRPAMTPSFIDERVEMMNRGEQIFNRVPSADPR